MRKIFLEKAIIGLPNLTIEEGVIFEKCQIGNQTRMSHKKIQHLPPLEFLN